MCVGQLRSRGGVGVTSLLVILSRYNFLLKKYGVTLKNTTTEEVPRLSPAPTQVAVVRKALEVIRSDKGRRLRRQLWTNIEVLRSSLKDNNLSPLGARSPIVPVVVGPESIARTMHRRLLEHGLIVNVIEFPVR